MKLQVFILLFFLTGLLFTSCRKEETEFIETPEEEVLDPNSTTAILIQKTATNDGSIDNIIDEANCIDIIFPYTINANGNSITLNSEEDFATVECVFDASDDDIDTLAINFPVNIMLSDYTEVTVLNMTELNEYINDCNGENINDSDIECIDFQYPITASIFNPNNELIDTIVFTEDRELYMFIETINTNDIITFEFPISLLRFDNSEVTINDFNELEAEILSAQNSCDEDDDYDYNDDDCNDCTTAQITSLLTNCTDWEVNILRRDNTNYDDVYETYAFNFFNDGTLSVFWNTTTVYGTWTADGLGNDIEILVNIPSLPLCNNNWILREIKSCSVATEIDLRVGSDDRLQYFNDCN